MCIVDQESQCFVGISLLERVEAGSGKIGNEVR